MDPTASVARLAAVTGYTKRNIADECETLQLASVLSVRSTRNRFYYSLARRVALEESFTQLSLQTFPVRVKKTLRLIDDDLAELGIERSFDNIEGTELWPAVRELGLETLGAWSIGQYHEMPSAKIVRKLRQSTK